MRSSADTELRAITRDGGFSVQYSTQPALSLWLFGDTSQRNGPRFIGGTTAAVGAVSGGGAPTQLHELPTPRDETLAPGSTSGSAPEAPQPFFPTPEGLVAPGSSRPCGAPGSGSLYPAAWPAGGAREPGSSTLLLVYLQVCVTKSGFPTERLTLTRYDSRRNQWLGSYTPFAAVPLNAGLAPKEILESPLFGPDGYVYLYASDRHGVYVARVAADPHGWGNASNYRWWSQPAGSSGEWSHDESTATSLVTAVRVYGAHVADYSATTLHKYVLLIQTALQATSFALYEASSPQGPWAAGPTGRVPDDCRAGIFGCYSLYGHPEFSTPGLFVYSWYSPGQAPGQGRVKIGGAQW